MAGARDLTYVRTMSPLKKVFLPIVATVAVAALLVPASATAQRNCVPPNSPRCQQAERFKDKREEINQRREGRLDAQRGITPACRAAHDKYTAAVQARSKANSGVKGAKSRLNNAKGKKAKAKRAKALKKAKAKLKKAKKTEAGQLTARTQGCQGSTVPS